MEGLKKISEKKDFFTLITVVVALISIYLQIFPPKTSADQLRSLIYFIFILAYVGALYVINWIIKRTKEYTAQVNSNTEEIQKLKQQMDQEKRFANIEKELAVIGAVLKVNKKGKIDIDPRFVLIIILLVLFYLYLRSLGIVP